MIPTCITTCFFLCLGDTIYKHLIIPGGFYARQGSNALAQEMNMNSKNDANCEVPSRAYEMINLSDWN